MFYSYQTLIIVYIYIYLLLWKIACFLPLKLTVKAPENRPRAPKGNEKVFQPSIFRGEHVSFREGRQFLCGLLGFIHIKH